MLRHFDGPERTQHLRFGHRPVELLLQLFQPATQLQGEALPLQGLPQRRLGVGFRSLGSLPTPAAEASLTVAEVDAAFTRLATTAGAGSTASRRAELAGLMSRATADEQRFLVELITGNLRQGALDGVALAAIATAYDVPDAVVRRAAAHFPVPLRVVDASRAPGINVGRNDGVAAAAGTSILLCDADDEVAPGWLHALAAALADADLVGGSVDLRGLNSEWSRRSRSVVTPHELQGWLFPIGANIGFLGANVAGGSFDLNAALAVGLNNPDNDAEGKITLAELLGTTLEGLIAFTPTGSFNANFPISVTLGSFLSRA